MKSTILKSLVAGLSVASLLILPSCAPVVQDGDAVVYRKEFTPAHTRTYIINSVLNSVEEPDQWYLYLKQGPARSTYKVSKSLYSLISGDGETVVCVEDDRIISIEPCS